ncbi:DUF4375 domain-containing protein [Lysinibacillus sp. SGAir0095]|uniref:DMP19 family protein n=1 Tax=Lysinibacillus sp. SGAir0095 TaxID=2070463 RepID=UPI0010CCD6A0|nr:DUF4375 domain-containing protein [Lysinibacillus sp. SGAir0095]QCR31148.1 hypothetical protein C1N55_02800 [Lysinibacillus sp. SGAir0095]
MIKRTITKEMLNENPYEKWNQFIDLLAMEEYRDLTDIQKVAHLCFWYDSEVQNGGHLQYFLNRGTKLVQQSLDALKTIGANAQAHILTKAANTFNTMERARIDSVDEFIEVEEEGKFLELDLEYYQIEHTINDLLEQYLEKYETEFILVEK